MNKFKLKDNDSETNENDKGPIKAYKGEKDKELNFRIEPYQALLALVERSRIPSESFYREFASVPYAPVRKNGV